MHINEGVHPGREYRHSCIFFFCLQHVIEGTRDAITFGTNEVFCDDPLDHDYSKYASATAGSLLKMPSSSSWVEKFPSRATVQESVSLEEQLVSMFKIQPPRQTFQRRRRRHPSSEQATAYTLRQI